jgi:hypothetical protein
MSMPAWKVSLLSGPRRATSEVYSVSMLATHAIREWTELAERELRRWSTTTDPGHGDHTQELLEEIRVGYVCPPERAAPPSAGG